MQAILLFFPEKNTQINGSVSEEYNFDTAVLSILRVRSGVRRHPQESATFYFPSVPYGLPFLYGAWQRLRLWLPVAGEPTWLLRH